MERVQCHFGFAVAGGFDLSGDQAVGAVLAAVSAQVSPQSRCAATNRGIISATFAACRIRRIPSKSMPMPLRPPLNSASEDESTLRPLGLVEQLLSRGRMIHLHLRSAEFIGSTPSQLDVPPPSNHFLTACWTFCHSHAAKCDG